MKLKQKTIFETQTQLENTFVSPNLSRVTSPTTIVVAYLGSDISENIIRQWIEDFDLTYIHYASLSFEEIFDAPDDDEVYTFLELRVKVK